MADAFLMHDRPIHVRCDDSVVRVFPVRKNDLFHQAELRPETDGDPPSIFPIRRSRGYAPFPVRMPWEMPPLLAVGAELKNTFCITHGRYAFLSHHIGDLENYETLESFLNGAAHFERLFRVQPQALAYDLHPDYLATRYALERSEREGLPAVGVQHHHAHVAACLAEYKHPGDRPVIGIAFDGTGYGDDGAIWGGEFLLADYRGYRRVAHLDYVPLPGGDAAIRKPARTALAYLWRAGVAWDPRLPCVESLSPEEQLTLCTQLERGVNAPLASSTGRLFDAVAAIAGGRQKVNYEAQAAIEFEAALEPSESGRYLFEILPRDKGRILLPHQSSASDWAVAEDRLSGTPDRTIAARFRGLARMVLTSAAW
jgi:hydrogenase maturation protein HypF